jgi:hypothetical protein
MSKKASEHPRQDKIPNTVVLDRAGILSINTLLLKPQLRWAGHVEKIVFYSEMLYGKSSCGGQKRKFKNSLKSFHIKTNTWDIAAQERTSTIVQWRVKHQEKPQRSCEGKKGRPMNMSH